MKTYKAPRKLPRARLKRQAINPMDAASHKEWLAVILQCSDSDALAQIQSRFPNETPEEIKRRLAFVRAGGAKPAEAKALTPGRIPQEVIAARKAERKAQVKANHHQRKVGELSRSLGKEARAVSDRPIPLPPRPSPKKRG